MFKTTNDDDIWPVIQSERKRVLSYLQSMPIDQWDHQSQCDEWKVRDVVAHLSIEYKYSIYNSFFPFIHSGFRFNKFIELTAVTTGKKPISELLNLFEDTVDERALPKGLSPFNPLADLLIHEQDIRIPLGDKSDMPKESLRLIFTHWEPTQYNFGEKITGIADRVNDLTFVATDLGITVGHGEEVRGNAQDILFAITGRQVAKNALSGAGVALLLKRIT